MQPIQLLNVLGKTFLYNFVRGLQSQRKICDVGSFQGRAAVEVYENYDTLMFLGNVLFLHDLCTLTSVIEPPNIRDLIDSYY